MKPTVVIRTLHEADRRVVTEAALGQGCRAVACNSAADAVRVLAKDARPIVFCDAALAEGGGAFSSLAKSATGRGPVNILIITGDIKAGLLKSLKPWVHDYINAPVLREAATAKIRNVLRERELERAAERATSGMREWLSRLETMSGYFDALTFDRAGAHRDLSRRLLRQRPDDTDRPSLLLIGTPEGGQTIRCMLTRAADGRRTDVDTILTLPETSFFLRIRACEEPFQVNATDRGLRHEDFQALFPPELLSATGPIHNVAGLMHDGTYILAMNYGRPVTPLDALFLKGLALPGRFLCSVAGDVKDMSDSFLVIAQALALATDSQNDNGAHVRRMNAYAVAIARRLDLPEGLIRTLSYSAQLHDVGKIYVHPDLLEKPLRLTPHEFDLVKKHPVLGARILGDSPLLRVARNIALTHHESWDGSGYPAGLRGEAIPLEGAIVKIADVYDALRTMHSYKSSYSHDDACRCILDGGGDAIHEIRPQQFHPDVLRAFTRVAPQFDEIYQTT